MNKILLLGVLIGMFVLGGIFGTGITYQYAMTHAADYDNISRFITECNTKLLKCCVNDGFYDTKGKWVEIFKNESEWRLSFNGTRTKAINTT